MRVLFIAAVLGTLAHPAQTQSLIDFPFGFENCVRLKSIAKAGATNAIGLRDSAMESKPYDRDLMKISEKNLEEASHAATIYLAFCMDY